MLLGERIEKFSVLSDLEVSNEVIATFHYIFVGYNITFCIHCIKATFRQLSHRSLFTVSKSGTGDRKWRHKSQVTGLWCFCVLQTSTSRLTYDIIRNIFNILAFFIKTDEHNLPSVVYVGLTIIIKYKCTSYLIVEFDNVAV